MRVKEECGVVGPGDGKPVNSPTVITLPYLQFCTSVDPHNHETLRLRLECSGSGGIRNYIPSQAIGCVGTRLFCPLGIKFSSRAYAGHRVMYRTKVLQRETT